MLGCDKFLDLDDPGVLQNCDSLDFVEELDYMAAQGDLDDIDVLGDNGFENQLSTTIDDLPFSDYVSIIKSTATGAKTKVIEAEKTAGKDAIMTCTEQFLRCLITNKFPNDYFSEHTFWQ